MDPSLSLSLSFMSSSYHSFLISPFSFCLFLYLLFLLTLKRQTLKVSLLTTTTNSSLLLCFIVSRFLTLWLAPSTNFFFSQANSFSLHTSLQKLLRPTHLRRYFSLPSFHLSSCLPIHFSLIFLLIFLSHILLSFSLHRYHTITFSLASLSPTSFIATVFVLSFLYVSIFLIASPLSLSAFTLSHSSLPSLCASHLLFFPSLTIISLSFSVY